MSQIEDFLGGKPAAGSPSAEPKNTTSQIDSFLGERPKDNALVRGWKSMSNSVGITKDLATGDAAAVARRVKEFDDYSRANPGSQQGQELSNAWEQGDGITGGVKGVAGEIAKDWKEAPNWMGGVRSVAGNLKAMGDGLVAQVPNMLAPMAGMVGGAAAGAAAGSAIPVIGNVAGGVAGAWAGASAGNTLVEGGGMLMDRLNKAGINPQDTAAVEKFAREQGDAALGDAAIKGGIIGAVDTATAGLAGKILNAPARAAADRALASLGVNTADSAAVKAATKSDAFKQLVANDATYKAATSGAGNVARNVGVAALDPAGEFAGEFVGQGVATGDWDTKNAALEAISSMGQSAIMYGGQKAYQAATNPLRGKSKPGDGAAAEKAEDEAPQTLLLENKPGTMVVFPDGTVGRDREVENYLANLPEDQRAEARAKLFRKTITEVNDPKVQRWWENYAEGQPPTATVDHLAAVQAAVRNGTGFSTAQTVDTVRNAMEDAWLEANVRNEPDSAVQLASDAGQQLGGQMAQFSEELSAATAAVDAQLRTTRILSGLQNAMDSGAMGSAASINYVNDALTRIGEQPMAQDEMARATRLLDAHAAFTGQTTPAPLPGDLASQNPLVDRYADNSAMESLIRRPMSERMGVDPSKGGISKAAAMAVDSVAADEAASAAQLPGATQPLGMQNPLLAPMANNAMAPVESAFNINGAINGTEANQTQQGFAQSAQAGPAQAGENAAAAVSQATGIQQAGATPGPAAQGLTDGSSTAINNGAQAQSQNAAQGQEAATQSASQSGAAAGGNVVSASNAGASEFDAARAAIKLEANQTTSDPMTIGSTPKTGDAVSVRDGVVYLGKYEALDYDSGEPITVPPGATRGQVAQALRAGGVLTDRQKVFGLNGRENESIEGPSPATATAPVPAQVQAAAPEKAQATAPVAPAATTAPAGPAAQATNPKQRKAIDRIHSEKGAFFFSKPKAEDFLADNGLQDQYEVVQKEKAFVIQARKAQSATENVADDGADQTPIKQAASDPIAGRDLGDGWAEFTPESGTKAVPRGEMPQIKAEHRGAMVNFMNARGVTHEEESVPAASLKPTQREFSREKVEKAKAFTGGNRAILTSRDGHVLDGHHQWMAARENGEDVRVIRLDSPIDDLLKLAHDFPSSTVAEGAESAGQTGSVDLKPLTMEQRDTGRQYMKDVAAIQLATGTEASTISVVGGIAKFRQGKGNGGHGFGEEYGSFDRVPKFASRESHFTISFNANGQYEVREIAPDETEKTSTGVFDKANWRDDAIRIINEAIGNKAPNSENKAASASAIKNEGGARKMSADGRPVDGKPLMPNDRFEMVSGRVTTPFPIAKGDLAMQRWLALNALNEAKANGDDFNGTMFQSLVDGLEPSKQKERRALSPADMDALNMFLWEVQPEAVPSILKPLTGSGIALPGKLDSKGFDAWIAKNGSEHPYQFLAKGERGDNGVGMITLSGEIEQQGANWAGNARGPKDNRDQRNVFRLNDGKLVYWDADTGLTLAVSPDDKRLEITKQEPEAKEQLNPTEIAFDMNDEHYSIFFDQPLENLSEQEFEDELYTRGYPSAVQDRFRDEYKKAQTRNESKGTAKPRLGETANKVWSEIRRLNTEGIHYPGQGLLHPVMEVVGGDWFMLDSNSRLKLVDRGAASLSYSEPTDAQTAEFHDALNKDQIQVRLMSRAGYKSGYKQPSTLQVLHSPSGNSFGAQAPEVSVIAKIKARNEEAERAEREAAVKKAAEREARQASREVERDLFRHLTSSTGGLAGKPLEQVTEAIKVQLASRDATTAINPVQISRLARAIHKHLQANSKKLDKDAARDPAAKAAAIDQGLASYGEVILPEQIDGFVLGFEHALSGKTKSTLSGEGLPDMLKGYEAATDWIDTDAGAAWFEGKRRKKLENTGVDLRRHWEAMKAQMKASETDVQKVWKQIEAATNRAELFSPYLPEGAAPGWVAYVTELRASTKTFKQFLFDGNYRWIGSSAWGRKGKDAANLEFVLEGKRYPADMSEEQRAQWKTDQAFRVQQLRDAAELYIEKVQKLTAFLDGLSSVKDASERFVETMVAENYQAKARDKNAYFSRYEHIHDKTMEEVIRGGRAGAFDKGVWGGDSVDFAKFRTASAWTETLIEKQDTLALPTRATPLTPPKLDRVERVMPKDHRGGKDVTPEQFKDKFGFADVGFGNWVGAKNDQDHLNYAYDAFMDLAEHFGFAPKNIGLGGALHFTVGALGHGKFAAHFSPNHPGPNGAVQVINLTNTKGDGTVYHEWSHALDHNLGGEWKAVRRAILNALQYKAYEASDWERIARNFLVGGSYWKGNKNQDKLDAAIKGLTYYAAQGSRRGQTAYKENADKLGKDYWGNEAELFARATEAWAADSLGGTNSYLVNKDWVGDGKVTQAAGFRGTPYPTGGERALFGKYMTALAKSVKFIDGKPSVTLADFEKNLPEDMGAGEARRKELLTKDGMQAYYEQILEERAMAAEEKARREREKEAEEKAKADALAAEALAELEALSKPSVLDTPPASSTPGPLTEDDLSSIFDEAAAELREENQEKPEAPAPGETAKPVADSSGKPSAEDAKQLQKLVEDGSMVLFSGTDWAKKNGLPSIHSFQSMPGEVRHMGYGVFDYISPEFSGTYTGGGAMEKTEGGIAYTTFGVTKGRWDYPKARVLEALKALSEKTEAVAPKAAGKEASASPKAPAPAEDKNAAKLIAEAAKLGVTGANEALSGLAKLFGGGKGGRLNSFPAGFDEETYKAAKPHFKAALTAFQEAGKTLKDLFKLLIQNFGDGVKDYAIQFAKDEGLTAQLGKAPVAGEQRSPSGVLANWVKAQLERGEADGSFDWRALFEQADAAFGGTQAEGKYTPKDAYDAMEAGVNQFILSRPAEFNPNASADAAHIVVERLHRLTQMLPTQTKRTAEQDEFQQFSTVPALAYAANWAANMDSTDTMMEPSAGIGGLAAFAKNAGVKLILNELSSRRAAVLREVFPAAKVYTENAEQIDNILPESEIPSVVVMNPPFSATAGRIQGKRDTHVGALHVEQGLKRLADGGRLVAIVGEGMNLDRPAFSAWWKEIRAKYDVRAVIPMDGSGYAKYGTTYDNAILVIDKVKPSGRPIVTTPAKTYSELIGSLAEIRNDRPESVFPSNDTDGFELNAAEQALAEPAQAGERVAQPEQSGRDDGADVGRAESGRGQGVGSGGGRSGRAGGSGRAGVDGAKSGAGRGAGRNDAGGSGDAAAAGGGGSDAAESAVSIQAADQVADPAAGLTDAIFESYQPQRLQVPGAKPHPGPLVQSSAMAAVLPPVPTYTPNLPKETIEKGLLSIAQIEAVVYAGQAHQELLEPITVDGKDVAYRRGFFIGDGTGVGKGREISGIILDNLRQGREKAVWISEKPGLLADAQRDFSGIGGDPKQIFNVSKTKAEEQINTDKGIAFLSYATLRSGAKSQEATATPTTKAQFAKQFPKGLKVVAVNGRGTYTLDHIDPKDGGKVWVDVDGQLKFMRFSMVESIDGQSDWQSGRSAAQTKGGKKEGQSRLDQLVNWLGKDFDGVIAFDEAHNAGNAVAQKANRGQSQPSAQALAVVELQKRLPNARVVYVSATGATQVSNLSFATRLGLWGPSTPFASVQNFIAEMTAGGLAAMELVARDLKQMGAYMARSLSFEGVTYSRVEHQLSPLQQDIYNRLAEAWQVTLQNIDAALEKTGAVDGNGKGSSSAKSAAMSAYWGAQQRFFSQVITSMQMPSVLEQMERDIAEGKALVLQLVNTNEAQQNRSIAKRRDEDESADLEELDLTPRDVLIQMVEKSFPVTQFEEQEDDSGKKIRVPAKDSEGNPVINREAVAMRDALLKDLKDIRVPDGPLEIVLNHFGVDKVAEVTGRTQRVVRKQDKDGEIKAQLESRGPASARADANAFMADQKQILVFSDAGGTGYSFHADNTQKNKRKRAHYLIQPGWRADKAVQGFGRTHRTNQASAPHYYLASTNVPSQKRFLSAIARRLDQLGALTKGQRDTANQGMFSEKDNLESIYASQAVQQFFKDGQHQQLDGISFSEYLRQTGLEGLIDEETNRIAEDRIPDTRTFLNRMLSLKLDMQEKVFDAFMLRMEEKVEMAVERGEFDAGLQTIRALETRVVADDLAYTDPRSGAETRLVELELTQPTTIYPFPHSLLKADYVVNEKSGKVYAKTMVGKATTKDGAVVDRYRFHGTGSVQSKTAPEVAKGYRPISKAEAIELWAAENEARPKTYTERKHMIVGAMLPIWDRLKTDTSIQVARTMTVDGSRLLGRLIDKKSLPDVRKRLNVASAASKMKPAEVMAQILKGDKAELANGWTLERARVSDDLRIELKNPNGGYFSPAVVADMVGMGVVRESISWKERYFVPTGAAGVPVLERLTKTRPVVELQSEQESNANYAGAAQRRPASAQDKAVMQAIADGKSSRDVLRVIASGSKDPFLRQVARMLLKTGITPNIEFGHIGLHKGNPIHGQYRGKTDTIAIAGSAEYAAERIFMHEAMHAATMRALAKPGLARLQLQKLAAHVRKQPGAAGFYGISDKNGKVDEFVAEVFTNPDFQAALRKMKAPSDSSTIKTAWDGFVRILRSILGLKNDPDNVLSQALSLGVAAMREDMALRKSAKNERSMAVSDREFLDGNPVASMRGDEVPRLGGQALLVNWAAKHFENSTNNGVVNHPEIGEIKLDRRSAKDSLSHGYGKDKIQALYLLPDVLPKAKVLHTESRKEGQTGYVLGAPVEIGGKAYVAAMVVTQHEGRTGLYVHEVVLREKLQGAINTGAPVQNQGDAQSSRGNPGAIRSVLERIYAVNPDDQVANFGMDDATAAAKNIGQGLKAITATDVKKAGSHKLTDWLKMGLQFLGRRQLVDIYGDTIPMAEYDRLVAQMEADKNDVGAEADNLATRWGKLKDDVQLSELMHDATLAEIDADSSKEYVEGDNKPRSAALKRRFDALSTEAKAVYREARDHYREHHKQVRSAIRERIMRAELSSKKREELLKKMDADFFGYVKGVYFPLARFGQYVVATKDEDGKVISVSRAETMPEAERMREEMRKAFPADKGFAVGRVTLSKDFIATHDMVGRGFMSEVFAALDKQDIPAEQRAELEDTLGQLYLSSLPDLSWAKHGIHRKGTPGFSQDARRAFAQNSFHGARYLAKLKYSDLMANELDYMQKHVDTMGAAKADFDQPKAQRVVDEMQKRHDQLMNPKTNSLSTALTSFGFIFHLGLSPAAAMVNLSQTALVAYPVMGAKWGFKKSAEALLRASNESVKGKNDIRTQLKDKDELDAYDEAVRSGVIDVTMAHDLAGIAQGEDAGVMWKLQPVMRAASFLFHHAERFNRQATFMAAYRLAREAGTEHHKAYEEAVKATYDGHFDYGAANRPRLMQGNVARVVLLFKQFSQNMIYTLGRNAYLASKGDKQAMKTFAGLITMHAAGAGVLGLPLVGPLLALASVLGGDDDEPWDAEIALRNQLADVFGKQASEVISKGFSRLTPWDVSGRIGLDNLIFPDIREGLEGKMWAQEMAIGILGPVVGIGINAARGSQLLAEGDYMRGLENMTPVVLRNAIKSARFLKEGAKDSSGITVKDEVGAMGVLGQFAGFSPSEVRLAFEGRGAVMDADRRLNVRRSELLGEFAHAVMKKDTDAQAKAKESIKVFNEKNPGRRITNPQMWQSVRARQRRIDQAQDGVYLPRNRRESMEAGGFAF